MCIIVAKRKGLSLPNETALKNCWESNSDGAGLAWYDDKKKRVKYAKGFMSYSAFKGFLDDLCTKIDVVETSMVLHFRITSKGKTCPEQCHPFPVSSKNTFENVKKLEGHAPIVMAHNGTMSFTPVTGYNDTQTLAVNYLSHLHQMNSYFLKDISALELIEEIMGIGNKLAFVTKENEIIFIGKFVEDEHTGILYSNNGYLTTRYYPYSKYGYGYDYGYSGNWEDEEEAVLTQMYGYNKSFKKDAEITNYANFSVKALLNKYEDCLKDGTIANMKYLTGEVEERYWKSPKSDFTSADFEWASRLINEYYLKIFNIPDVTQTETSSIIEVKTPETGSNTGGTSTSVIPVK